MSGARKTSRFAGANGVSLCADSYGPDQGELVVLLHGGGQTRFAWSGTAAVLAAKGYRVVVPDLRGHGESDWAPDGSYDLDAHLADLVLLLAALSPASPVLVGASLGGLTALLAVGERKAPAARALVLVDIAPRIEAQGARKVGRFMTSSPDGFESIEAAADAVAAYLPHRPRPADTSGLARNLRLGPDGRYRWHWDPRMLQKPERGPMASIARYEAAAGQVGIPALLVRGAMSDVISMESVEALRQQIPQLEFVNIAGADHMVAGDRNDSFGAAVTGFLDRL
jgi:non-heme chloroperoxidase